jgi:hypothetical protein
MFPIDGVAFSASSQYDKLEKNSIDCTYSVITLLVKLDGGETRNLSVVQLVGCGIDLGNHNLVIVLELLSQLQSQTDKN